MLMMLKLMMIDEMLVDNAHVRKCQRAKVVQRCAAWAWPLSLGAELFEVLAQVHRLCNAVLLNAQLGSIARICA